MKSIPLLLYLVAAGLFGFAGWTVYEMLPQWKDEVRQNATKSGYEDARGLLAVGKGEGQISRDWRYDKSTADWWAKFKDVNLIGKLPPPPPEAVVEPEAPVVEVKPVRPLEEIIELVSLAYDGMTDGRGGKTHVIVRWKAEANVQPPEWYVRENTPPVASAPGPRDVTPAAARVPPRANGPGARPTTPRPTTPMPTSIVGQEILQQLWVEDEGDIRRSPTLWPPFEDIRLVRVDPSAKSAFFVRAAQPGQAEAEPKEEELLKTSMGLSPELARELRRLQHRDGDAPLRETPEPPAASPGTWVDVEETTLIHGVRHIGRKDARSIQESGDRFFEQVHFDTYVSKRSDLRGLIVRNVDTRLAQQFGVQSGDVLLEVNGRAVQTQAQAIQFGKADWKRGVRTFQTKWLTSTGQIVDRTYQAPSDR